MRIGTARNVTALTLLATMALTIDVWASDATDASGYYLGKLGGTEKVQMLLNQEGSTVEGWYFYERNGGHLQLSGTIDTAGQIVLSEYLISKDRERMTPTGEFRGVFTAMTQTFGGTWRSSDGSKTLKFEFGLAANTLKGKSRGFRTIATSARPIFADGSTALKAISEQCRNVAVGNRVKFVKENANPKDEYLVESNDHKYEATDDIEVQYVSADLVSVLRTHWEFTGGAHGNSTFTAYNWRIVNGAAIPVNLDDLFVKGSGWEASLSTAVRRELRKCGAQRAVSDPNLSFNRDELSAFCLGPKGLAIHFAPYAVDCYAAGAFEVTVPYTELKGVIRSKGALGKFVAVK